MACGDADRRAYEERARDIRVEVAAGKTIDQVMADWQMERIRQLREMTDAGEQEPVERLSIERQDRW